MKKSIQYFFLLAIPFLSFSQTSDSLSNVDEIFTIVDESASFPGGIIELSKFLSKNIKYPKQARKQKIEETVLVSFIVEKNGSISNINCYFQNNILLKEEAARVIGKMPKWIPAKKDGEKVRQNFIQPIQFKL